MKFLKLTIPKFIKDILTEDDGESFDFLRCGSILSGLYAMAMQGWSVIINKLPFDTVNFATGMAALLAASGAAVGILNRKKNPPEE